VKACQDELLLIALYVDDLIFIDNSQKLIDEFKKVMEFEFEMTSLKDEVLSRFDIKLK
jgi:hypothetical protein